MKIYVARYGGVCFGVQRAIEMALEAVKKGKPVYSLGPLIHNRFVVQNLGQKGIITVNSITAARNKRIIVRSHGIHPKLLKKMQRQSFQIIDATCPRVRRAQRYVERLIKEGYHVIIIGEKDHPEVKGLLGYGGANAEIFSNEMKIKKRRIGVVPQTTLDLGRFNNAIAALVNSVTEMKIYNTICKATILRIREAVRIAKKADMMIIIGGKNSANTSRLYEECQTHKPSHHIESPREIQNSWFKDIRSVGITAGASTPKEQVDEVARHIMKEFPF